jgi:predicted dithiol-disulfide oxidoreductase (DUF899 family)
MNSPEPAIKDHRMVNRQEWRAERIALLKEEKAFTRQRDELSKKVRALPWVKVDKTYTFDSPTGPKTMTDLFGPRSQLVTYHFMFDPTWSQGCMGCSFIADHYNGLVVHLAHRDITLVTVSTAPVDKLEQFRKRMGWTFPWVSAANTDFGRDFGVSFTDQELAAENAVYNFTDKASSIREYPGMSVFVRDAHGVIFHTYSTFARGLENFLAAYQFIDITPKGRDEGPNAGMHWVRHHDRYDDTNFVVPWMEKPGVTSPPQRP